MKKQQVVSKQACTYHTQYLDVGSYYYPYNIQKARLDQIRKEKELEDHEEDSMGDYVRIYPTTDWTKAKVYNTLIKSANKVSLVGKQLNQTSIVRTDIL